MDIQMAWAPITGKVGLIDLAQDGPDLATGRELDTAVIMSLFTNRLANDDDLLPSSVSDRQGWWSDTFPVADGDRIGSRLWLLQRETQTQDTLNRAREYAKEALQWLVDDRVAASVDVQAEYNVLRPGALLLGVTITRPDGQAQTYRYSYLWDEIALTTPGDELLVFNQEVIPLLTEAGDPLTTETGERIILEPA
jgi:phage gp46-like protein